MLSYIVPVAEVWLLYLWPARVARSTLAYDQVCHLSLLFVMTADIEIN